MTEIDNKAYKQRAEELGKVFLDAISSISQGDFNVNIDVPEDMDVFADLAVGLEFMAEDLREAAKANLEDKRKLEEIAESKMRRTGVLHTPQASAAPTIPTVRAPKPETDEKVNSLTYTRGMGTSPVPAKLPSMEAALQEKRSATESNGQDVQSLTLPIQLQDEVIGVIGFNRSKDRPWTQQEIATVETITEQIGLALENQRLFEQTQTALAETETLYQATAELNTADSYTQILQVLKRYSQVGGLAGHMSISIFNQPEAEEEHFSKFSMIASIPDVDQDVRPQDLIVFNSAVFDPEAFLSPDQVTVIQDISTEHSLPFELREKMLELPDTKAMAFIPMVVGGQWIGLISCNYPSPVTFSEDEIRQTAAISSQASVAIQNLYSLEIAQKAVEEMREVDRLKSEFLANMSHELRTPLNSIIGFSRVILKGIDGPINELQQQDLEAIHHSGQHLLDMINNILDISKIEAGKMELRIEEISLDDVIDSVVSTARGLVKEKPIKLLSEIPEQLPTVSADRTRVRQILLNLIQNAVKFTEDGSITVKITPDETHREVKISVIDTGIGIAPEDHAILFERFSQVDSSLTRKVGGSGLGLSITKLLVEMQGGEIDLVSEVGEGSEFWFTLPLAAVPASSEVPTQERDPNKKVIISIDDDDKIIDLYKRYLRTHGYEVVGITEPQNVIQQIKEIKPYAITLDLMMPQKDGWQVIQEIKNDPETADIPVIICSILEDKDKAYQLGAVDYLVKPILENELVSAVNNLGLPHTKEGNRILVIDDDPNVYQLIEIALRDLPRYSLSYANGGFAGLDKLKTTPPEAVILDLMMPDLDGFSILETMQGDPNLRKIPVIILTAAELSAEQRDTLLNAKQQVLSKQDFKGQQLINFLEDSLNDLESQNEGQD